MLQLPASCPSWTLTLIWRLQIGWKWNRRVSVKVLSDAQIGMLWRERAELKEWNSFTPVWRWRLLGTATRLFTTDQKQPNRLGCFPSAGESKAIQLPLSCHELTILVLSSDRCSLGPSLVWESVSGRQHPNWVLFLFLNVLIAYYCHFKLPIGPFPTDKKYRNKKSNLLRMGI